MKRIAMISVLTILASAAMSAAQAKPNRDHGSKPPSGASDRQSGVDIDVSIVLGDRERQIVRDYYGSNCPPGLAKKRNGCLPPGIAKKRYEIGRRIPEGWAYVPDELIIRLPRLGGDRAYRLVDGDLVIVAVATLIVLDALDVF